jgi:DNA polymerase III delta prime subunit
MDPIVELCQIIVEKLHDEPDVSQTKIVNHVKAEVTANIELKTALKTDERIQQTIREGSKGYQTLVKNGIAYVDGTHYHIQIDKIQSAFNAVLNDIIKSVLNINSELKKIDFTQYLECICRDSNYGDWKNLYTPITVANPFTMGLQGVIGSIQNKNFRHLKLKENIVFQKQANIKENLQEDNGFSSAIVALRKNAKSHVLLEGRPGSGKTTTFMRLIVEYAEIALDNEGHQIPVLLKLRRCSTTIENMIQDIFCSYKLFISKSQIINLLEDGKLLLLLDGLNEIQESMRIELTTFREKYHRTTAMIFSTRNLSEAGGMDFKYKFTLLPLTNPQIKAFIERYLGDKGQLLFQQISDGPLRKLAGIPLFLWTLCRIFVQNEKLPSNMGIALREFSLLYEKDIQADISVRSKHQWPSLLRHLSYAMLNKESDDLIQLSILKEEAENILEEKLRSEGRERPRENAENWLMDLLKYHIIDLDIRPNMEEYIEFPHQLFQEYYAAEYLLRLFPKLSDEQLKNDFLQHQKWIEPIALMLSLIGNEEEILRIVKLAMNEVDELLGARLAGEVQFDFQEATVGLINALEIPLPLKCQCWQISQSEWAIPRLLGVLESGDHKERNYAISALGMIGNDTAINRLLLSLESDNVDERRSAVRALGLLGDEKAIMGLAAALTDPDYWVSHIAEDALIRIEFEADIPGLTECLRQTEYHISLDQIRMFEPL